MKPLQIALTLCALLIGCKPALFLLRPYEASAIKGQQPTPAKEHERFVDQSTMIQDVAYLASPDCDGREVGTPGNALARAYIEDRMQKAGLDVKEQPFTIKYKDRKTKREEKIAGVNILGVLPGTNPDAKWIIISAHYDHLGRSEKKGDFYPGADDNAAGVSALIALAKYFKDKPTSHTLVFAAFDAEEEGSIGAKKFLRENEIIRLQGGDPSTLNDKGKTVKDSSNPTHIAFNFNLDMISRSDKQELFAITHNEPDQDKLRGMLFALQPKVGYKLMVSVDDKSIRSLASDHMEFMFYQIPFLYLGVSDHEDYHQPSDKVAKIDPEFYTAVVDSAVLMLTKIDELY